ncbi:ABC transporter ATP-binding protein [Saccharothrix texasensis]|uniref:Putative ABC transport system ATP-binding protein n=1 Tax=Saccharothrix texasensis TaxID=103734 RepID=A0A3N1HHF8_9PSEU|nr:ABC transporter ATP-binding protein [Saccharothrix texasensis]ROP41959.1 putative ABC transport system ATP-binding protein [Saccharothrix texasensis]
MSEGLLLERVSLRYGDGEETTVALEEVSLRVEPGEIIAVVGPSGAGKSSLLAVAGGLTVPDSGRVLVGGVDLAGRERDRARVRRERIGYVFQSNNLIPSLTAVDQVRLPLTFGRVTDPRDPRELLAAVGVEHKEDRRPHQLSGGERQRVGIARALVTRPDVLLVDEPTAALDRQRSHEVLELLARETRERRMATVVVTHDHDVLRHCDRVFEMVDGRLTAGEPVTA